MRIFLILFLFTITLSAQIKEKVFFESANPFAMSDVINDLDNQEKQEVYGVLTLPIDSVSNKKYPLIIGVAGSLAWRDHHYEYLDMYQKAGFATFELKSFKSRDIESTVGSQVEVTTAMMILDAYRALEKLSEHPNIDKNKNLLSDPETLYKLAKVNFDGQNFVLAKEQFKEIKKYIAEEELLRNRF